MVQCCKVKAPGSPERMLVAKRINAALTRDVTERQCKPKIEEEQVKENAIGVKY